MASGARKSNSAPQIQLTQTAAVRNGELWNICWRVKNTGSKRLRIATARLPHGQFKSAGSRFDPLMTLEPNEEACFDSSVWCDKGRGIITENAFVIFETVWLDEPWRIFARVRVAVNDDGKPQTKTELITAQKAGFSRRKL